MKGPHGKCELGLRVQGGVEAGIQRYSIGIETSRFVATALAGTPLASSVLAEAILLLFSPAGTTNGPGSNQPSASALCNQFASNFTYASSHCTHANSASSSVGSFCCLPTYCSLFACSRNSLVYTALGIRFMHASVFHDCTKRWLPPFFSIALLRQTRRFSMLVAHDNIVI
ncbi:hypothetical protein OYT13_11130 [Pandoraea sp. XJJ-1]|uniref:hypothetical protein n=1 Tax=Pandoraea sp. XJJ-1 TaxID=3002643 RepID=UPI0022804392|nr:hypothetical protein OYT13_11130 [Pandoraea sp. XJJ-1]